MTRAELDELRADFSRALDAATRSQRDQAAEIARLEALLRRAEAERAHEREEAARTAASSTSLVKSGRFNLSLSGYLQADGVLWRESSADEINPATGDPLNETRFLIRRARVRFDMDYGLVAGAIELDGNTVRGSQARLIGAEASLRWMPKNKSITLPYLQLTIGLFKTPFGYEIIESDRDRLFLERSNAERALFPGEYDLGVRLGGGWRFLRYVIAAMNGDPLGEKAFPGRDPTKSKDIMGRVGVDFHIGRAVTLAGGFSALWGTGFHKGTPATKDVLVWRDTNENNVVDAGEIQSIPGQPALPSQTFDRNALGGDLQFGVLIPRLGELRLFGELYYASNLDRGLQPADPVAAGRDQRELGYYVGATLELTKYAMIGGRYDVYNPDRDANDVRNAVQVLKDSSYTTIAAAAAIRLPRRGRLVLEYDHNTNALGRTPAGLPTRLADDAFTVRGQVEF